MSSRCWCGAVIYNGHHCENGHLQPRGIAAAVLAATLALASSPALSDDRVSWNHPTTRQDGTALPVGQIRGTVLRWAAAPDAATLDGSLEVAAPATAQVIARAETPGTRCYSAATVDTDGVQGPFSAWVCRTIEETTKAKPRVPKALTVDKAT